MGARISIGPKNKQDYATPPEFMEAVTKHFGPIAFDLAAHAGNTKSPHYYTPVTGPEGPLPLDPKAYGIDAFDHSWAELSKVNFFQENEGKEVSVLTTDSRDNNPSWKLAHRGRKGLLWLNPPFNDIPAWASRCRNEALLGANILLLTPLAVSNWFVDFIAGFADVYLLNGRISFIKGEPYNKDCMLSHFYLNSRDRNAVLKNEVCGDWRWMSIWDWRNDKILRRWGFPLWRIDELKTKLFQPNSLNQSLHRIFG